MKAPSLKQAEFFLSEAEQMNPGPWVAHNKIAAYCAKTIADYCTDLDGDTAYIFGLLHDIGRRFGPSDLKHTLDGYNFLEQQGFEDSAQICLTHSFPYKNIKAYNGKNDLSDCETRFLTSFLQSVKYSDYDRLIQLCDALSFPHGPTYIEKRLVDVVLRHGFNDFTVPKGKEFLNLKDYFDQKTSKDIYELLGVK